MTRCKNSQSNFKIAEVKQDGQPEMKSFSLENIEQSIALQKEMMTFVRLMCFESVVKETLYAYKGKKKEIKIDFRSVTWQG